MTTTIGRWFRRIFSVNPAWKDSLPPSTYRKPSPGDQPKYAAPLTKNSNLSGNYYYKRDDRRSYPVTLIRTQQNLAQRLSLSPTASLSSPATPPTAATTTAATTTVATAAATTATTTTTAKDLALVFKEGAALDPSILDALPGTPYVWKNSSDAVVMEDTVYWPLRQYA